MQDGGTTTTTPGEQFLDGVLRPIHGAWLREAHRFLDPTLEPGADFWARWAGVRYLADAFRERYRHERGLVDELRPFIDPGQAERLQHAGDHLLRLRLEVDRIGRRRGTAAEAAAATRKLLEQLALWCDEIELAAIGLTRDILPPEATELLVHLEAIIADQP